MKKIFVIGVGFICVIFMSSLGLAGPIVCKIGDATPKTFSYYPAYKIMEKEVEQRTGGKVDVQVFADGVLGGQKALLESTQMGSIQMCVIPTTWTQNIVREHRLFTLPFLWPNYEIYRRWMDSDEGRRVGDLLEKHGLKFLGYGHTGWMGVLNTKRELRTKEDFKGLKIRTMPDSVLVDSMNALGAMAVAMESAELYSATQQGVIDGVSTGPQFLYVLKLPELAKYYTHLGNHVTPAVSIMNLKFWNSLSPDIQKVFLETSKNWEKNEDAYYIDESKKFSDANIFKIYTEMGVKNYFPTPEDMQNYRKWTKPVFMKYREQVGAELVDSVAKFVGYK